MSMLRNSFIEEYIDKNYPNAEIIEYNGPDSGLVFYGSEELQSVDEDWFPLCCYKDEKTGKAVYGGLKKIFHTYTEGETGAGKTTRFVMQSIFALSSMKVKPSFVIVDIHGEIIENLYNHLIKNGYDIKILNCDNPQRSDTYNPFGGLVKECLKNRSLSNDAINKIRKIAEIIQPVESANDPIWDRGARSYTNGCILDKFEDLINGDIPEECLTIYNVIQNHYWLREALSGYYGTNDLFRIPHYKRKGSKALSVQKMLSVTNNAEKTRASYFGVVENHYDIFGQPSLYSLSSSNTIDIRNFIEKPTVIVIQSGSTKIGEDLISLLVNEIYTQVVKSGKENRTKKLPRNIHCFLDEFANCNIADGPEYIKMLTTSRKFGMFWHMILQCDAQLDRKFDPNIGRIIRANSTEIFMGSHDFETEVRFAKSCGQRTIESPASIISQKDPRLEVVDLITAEKLNLTEEGYAYIKTARHSLIKTYIEAFYHCSEFIPAADIDAVYPYNETDYEKTAFYPDDLPPPVSSEEYELLEYIMAGKKSLSELKKFMAEETLERLVASLTERKIISIVPEHGTELNVTPQQFELYRYRGQNGLNNYISTPVRTAPPRGCMPSPEVSDSEKKMAESADVGKSETTVNPLFSDIQSHLKEAQITEVIKKVSKLTCVPDFLRETIELLNQPDEIRIKGNTLLPQKPGLIKFEILEDFIRKNSFKTKKQWASAMKAEYNYLKAEKLLPESIMIHFRSALSEMQTQLSLSDIFEIKRIITESV